MTCIKQPPLFKCHFTLFLDWTVKTGLALVSNSWWLIPAQGLKMDISLTCSEVKKHVIGSGTVFIVISGISFIQRYNNGSDWKQECCYGTKRSPVPPLALKHFNRQTHRPAHPSSSPPRPVPCPHSPALSPPPLPCPPRFVQRSLCQNIWQSFPSKYLIVITSNAQSTCIWEYMYMYRIIIHF